MERRKFLGAAVAALAAAVAPAAMAVGAGGVQAAQVGSAPELGRQSAVARAVRQAWPADRREIDVRYFMTEQERRDIAAGGVVVDATRAVRDGWAYASARGLSLAIPRNCAFEGLYFEQKRGLT